LKEGNDVICVDNFYTGRKKNIENLKGSNFKVIRHDITKPLTIQGIDKIYNLACPASPPAYQKDPIFTWKTSVLGVLNVLELSRMNRNCPVLQSSTSEVYGDPLEHPQKESYWGNVNPIGIRSCYDEGKRAAETVLMDYHRQYEIPVRVIRIFNTYGPNMDPKDGRVVSNFIVQALTDKDITIYGDGSQTRSFQYVDDLVEGMSLMMDNEVDFVGPVNIGNPIEFTIKDLADMILKMIPLSKSIIIYKDIPKDDPKIRKPDISLAKKNLAWEPKIPLKKGLVATIDYFRSEILG